MQLTKYEHACFVVEKDATAIVIDPGAYTRDFVMPDDVAAIIVTHLHADHLDKPTIDEIMKSNPAAVIIGPSDVTQQLKEYETRTVVAGDNFTISGIELEFFGGDHATIHKSLAHPQNVGLMIEERIYYPGDAFAVPDKSVDILALPVSAPWMKLAEAIDFLEAIGPRFVFPTHDAILSSDGQAVVDRVVGNFATEHDIEYRRIDGETVDVL